MNGRCQKDALDRAEDICELCSNQYCAHCLLFPRGHRNAPTCKTCALESSGIRGGSTKRTAISKREYKKLKKELIAQLEEVEEKKPAIEYFELNDPSKFDRSTELDRRPAPAIAEEPTIDILNTGANETPAPAESIPPAPHAPTPTPQPAPLAATPPPPASAPLAAQPALADTPETTAEAFAPVDTSVNPLELNWSERRAAAAPAEAAAPAPSEASASAAELLARLKADQPIQSQFNSTPAELDTDPFASPGASPSPAPEPVPASLAPAAPTQTEAAPSQQPSTWSPPTPPPRGTNLAAKLAETEAAQGPPASRSGASFPAAAFPEPSAHEPPFPAEPLASAPIAPAPIAPAPIASAVYEPIQASPFHDAPIIPAPVAPAPVTPAPLEDNPFGNGVNPRPSQAAPPVEQRALEPEDEPPHDQQERRNADTDETGQWIPPSLRGMTTTDQRDPLPKRRS